MANFIVPKNVKSRFEFFSGFGWKELIFLLFGAVAGFLISGIIFIVSHNLVAFLIAPIGAVLGFFTGKTDPRTGKNLLTLIKDFKDFQTRPKRYQFRYGEGRK